MTNKSPWKWAAAAAVFLTTALALIYATSSRGQSAPALTIALVPTNQVSLTVTNALPTAVYEIYFTEFLDNNALVFTNGSWLLVASGSTGQSNFNFTLGDTDTGFFRAVNGNDFDNDGIPNYEDARPFDPGVGIMTITIETPANGSLVN